MGHTNEISTKTSSLVNPTSLNLQPRPFAPLESDEKEEAVSRKSEYSENFLEKIINTPRSESAPIQRKSGNRLKAIAAERMAIQAKLAIGEPNDKYEQEADATAARVVQQIHSPTPSQSQPIQRQELEEDEELQMKPIVQRRENLGGGEASTDLESSIQSARGSGQALDANLQQSMGQAMGADFSGVKVHTDSQSDQLNKSIQAKAFTTGQDLFFRQGAYEPSSRGGQELIAHELTHVVQQNGGVQRKEAASNISSSASISVSSDKASPIRRHMDKDRLNEEIETWKSAVAKSLMAGVLDQASADDAVSKIYANMFAYAQSSWQYKASFPGSSGKPLIEGTGTIGMCETYRNAFKYMLETYLIPLTEDYDPFAGGFNVQEGQELVSTRFVTKSGLSLLGNARGYNVTTEVDGGSGAETTASRYLFSSHWQLIVNGKTYDPLFQSVNTDNIEWKITEVVGNYYQANGADVAFVANPTLKATSGNEFAAQYVLLSNAKAFERQIMNNGIVSSSETTMKDLIKKLDNLNTKWGTVCKWYTGKASWRTPIQTEQAPEWARNLREIKQLAVDEKKRLNESPKDNLHAEVSTATLLQVLDDIQYQAGLAAKQLDNMIGVTETNQMGEGITKAIACLKRAVHTSMGQDRS